VLQGSEINSPFPPCFKDFFKVNFRGATVNDSISFLLI